MSTFGKIFFTVAFVFVGSLAFGGSSAQAGAWCPLDMRGGEVVAKQWAESRSHCDSLRADYRRQQGVVHYGDTRSHPDWNRRVLSEHERGRVYRDSDRRVVRGYPPHQRPPLLPFGSFCHRSNHNQWCVGAR